MSAPAVYALETLQALMVSTLAVDPMFSGSQSANAAPVPILTEAIGNLVTQVGISVGKLGLCLVVRTPLFRFTNNLAPSLDGWALVSCDVFEDVTLNNGSTGTQIPALSAAQRILVLMHHFPFALGVSTSISLPPYPQWSSVTHYVIGDQVSRFNASYVAIQNNLNVDPASDTGIDWAPISKFIGAETPLQLSNDGPPLNYTTLFQAHLTLSTPQP